MESYRNIDELYHKMNGLTQYDIISDMATINAVVDFDQMFGDDTKVYWVVTNSDTHVCGNEQELEEVKSIYTINVQDIYEISYKNNAYSLEKLN